MTNNYYKTLGVDILASKEDIRKAYLILAKKYHPDRNLDNKEEAEEKFKEITEAYETLYDDDLRARYDIQLRYVIETPKSQMETYQPCEEEKSEYIQLKRKTLKLVAMFLAIMLVAGIVLFFEYKYIQHSRRNSLEPGMTVDEVVEIYGEPSEITDDAIFYQTAKIYLRNGKVLGWYNADDILDIKNVDVENIYDIKVGENIEDVFHDYGYPDTYGQTFVTYYDVIIMYKDGKVTEVTRYSSD